MIANQSVLLWRITVLVDEWVETVWKVLQVRPKTVHDYKRLYRRHLSPVLGANHLDDVSPQILQRKLLSLPPQTARHTLMLAKTIWREAENYGVVWDNPLGKLKTPQIQIAPRKLILCSSFVRFPNRLASLANLLGLASYPIYLVHTHLGTAIINVLNARIENATVVFLGGGVLSLTLLCVSINLFAEKPLQKGLRRIERLT